MATRSCIGIKENKDTGRFIYCHWDGYPGYNGKMLLKYYNNIEKIKSLLSLGDISYLGPKINPDKNHPHTFDHPQEDVTVAYSRDRGDDFNGPKKFPLNYFRDYDGIDYSYLYDPELNKWYFRKGSSAVWKDLESYFK